MLTKILCCLLSNFLLHFISFFASGNPSSPHRSLARSKKHLPLPPGLPAPLIAICKQQQQRPQSHASASVSKEVSPQKAKADISSLPEPVHHQEHSDTHSTKPVQSAEMSGSLKYLLQRVVTEKISLSASVTNSEADIESIKERLTTSLAEINGLESEIEDLRIRLIDCYRQRGAIQFDEARAKADKDRLLLVVAEGRRELARLAGDAIEPSPLLSHIAERIAQSSAESIRHGGSGSSELSSLNSELDSLGATMASLTSERARVTEESNKLKNSLSSAQATLKSYSENAAKEKAGLEALRAENSRLRATLEASLQQLATHNAVAVTSPAHVPPPSKVPPSEFERHGASVDSFSNHQTGFDQMDSGFGGFDVPNSGFEEPAHGSFGGFEDPSHAAPPGDFNSFENDGFHSFGSPSIPQSQSTGGDGFAAFGGTDGFSSATPPAPSSVGSGGFASFDSGFGSPQPTTNFEDGFGGFGGDSFSPAVPPHSDGFAAFGAPAATTNASSSSNKFDAFDF